MSPELKETAGLIIAGIALIIAVVMIICLWVMVERNLKLKDQIKLKNERIKSSNDLIKSLAKALNLEIEKKEELQKRIRQYKEEVNQYCFVMRISDDISAEMQREIDTLKAKLNHKKRPAK